MSNGCLSSGGCAAILLALLGWTGDAAAAYTENAESIDHVNVATSGGYSVLQSDVVAEGGSAFHLAHSDPPQTQAITLHGQHAVAAATDVSFQSLLRFATPNQVARLQVAPAGGAWQTVWSKAGSGEGQSQFETVEVSLAGFAGQSVALRFVFELVEIPGQQTQYYDGVAWQGVGWFIDAIAVGAGGPQRIEYSIGQPSAEEQLLIELINRARADVPAEVERLRTTDDPDVLFNCNWFNVDFDLMAQQFASLPQSLPPLAPNARLTASARLHSQDMLQNASQSHSSSANPPPPNQPGDRSSDRAQHQGYSYSFIAENIFAYAKRPWHAHAAFQIEWGGAAHNGGMISPPGHRLAIHNATYREIGVGVVTGSNGGVGPMLVTQNFALAADGGQPLLTGVAYDDSDGDDFYSPGEGLGGVEVIVDGVASYAVTADSGGYAVPLPGDGDYRVRFRVDGQPDQVHAVTVSGGDNVKLDYQPRLFAENRRLAVADGHLELEFQVGNGTPSNCVLLRSNDGSEWTELQDAILHELGGGAYRFDIPLADATTFYKVRLEQ